jgi:hypothetical protein
MFCTGKNVSERSYRVSPESPEYRLRDAEDSTMESTSGLKTITYVLAV